MSVEPSRSRIKIAVVGLGKIARDQHVPALASSEDFELTAISSPYDVLDAVPCYRDIAAMLTSTPEIMAVAVCTPPQARYPIARYALEHGVHVLLEKPPAVTLGEALELIELAKRRRLTLFASWHSRHASAVEPARRWLAARKILAVRIVWKEDVRVWHPRQAWIWKAGGLGVFDPGINALSIVTALLPGSWLLEDAELFFPANCETPIAAQLSLTGPRCSTVQADLDFQKSGDPCWDIEVDTDAGALKLSEGGARLTIGGLPVETPATAEYPLLYSHFASLVRTRRVDADLSPLTLVAEALRRGRRHLVEPFIE